MRACVRACVRVCVEAYIYMIEIVTLLNLALFIYNFYTWLFVTFCLFVNVLYEWSDTKTNSYIQLNVTGD